MNAPVPRLRVFAGPNGSGKSTVKENLPSAWLGVYVNADEIEKSIRTSGGLPLGDFGIEATQAELAGFFRQSSLLMRQGMLSAAETITLDGTWVNFNGLPINSYFASVLADFIRHKLLQIQTSFTFETVMSSPDKVEFMRKARAAGFRTYLYFVATEDADINVARVEHRVAMGGHPVPENKIRSRYQRSLGLLFDAVTCTDRAYIFDNSGDEKVWIAEVTDGCELEMKAEFMPDWFKKSLWDRFKDEAAGGQ